MKLHLNLVTAVTEALCVIFGENRYADKVIESVLKSNRKWGARDRAFIAESTYEMVRWWRLLVEVYGEEPALSTKGLLPLFGVFQLIQGRPLPNWDEFKPLNNPDIQLRYLKAQKTRRIRESVPDWLDELATNQLGEKWETELPYLNEQAPVVLRANTLKTTRSELRRKLADASIETLTSAIAPDALILEHRQNIFSNPLFAQGYFEVQDTGSQAIGQYLDVQPGMRVIDACAGAGGKSLHLAALMQNKGTLISMDIEAWKLDELRKRANRAGVNIVQTKPIESSKTIKRLEDACDRLLLDVPCSGLGVLRRNPDAKWKLSQEFIDKVNQEQSLIINGYSKMVRRGGTLVYATCSILPIENETRVNLFLEQNKDYELLKQAHLSPSQNGCDGFYMAQILRK